MPGIKNKGQMLVMVMIIMSALMAGGIALTRAVLAERFMTDLYVQQEKALYLAEAGIEEAKVLVLNNQNWFTDNSHVPGGDEDWIIYLSTGYVNKLGTGGYKIVHESGKDIIYSVGFIGENIEKAKSRSIIRVKYNASPPKTYEFTIL